MMVFAWIGAIVCVLLGVAAVLVAYTAACEATGRWLNRVQQRAEALAIKRAGERLIADAWWFGEDEKARLALQCVGEAMARDLGGDVGSTRERWRRLCAGQTQ